MGPTPTLTQTLVPSGVAFILTLGSSIQPRRTKKQNRATEYIYSSLYYNCSIIRGRRTAARQVDQSPTWSPAQILSSFLFILSSRQHRVIIASIHYVAQMDGQKTEKTKGPRSSLSYIIVSSYTRSYRMVHEGARSSSSWRAALLNSQRRFHLMIFLEFHISASYKNKFTQHLLWALSSISVHSIWVISFKIWTNKRNRE